MSAFEDNPFAEDDGDAMPGNDATSRKRLRDSDSGLSAQHILPDHVPTALPQSSGVHFSDAIEPSYVAAPTAMLLADYEAGQEEDDYNTLVVRAAKLEFELEKQRKCHDAELDQFLKENASTRESVELLRATILQVRHGIEAAQTSEHTDDGTMNHGDDEPSSADIVVEAMQTVQNETQVLREAANGIFSQVRAEISSTANTTSFMERLFSNMVGEPAASCDLPCPDFAAESCDIEACMTALSDVNVDAGAEPVVALVRALVSELSVLLLRCKETHHEVGLLSKRVLEVTSLLRELANGSLDWYNRAVGRVRREGINDSTLHYACMGERAPAVRCDLTGSMEDAQLELTLRHLESIAGELVSLPSAVATVHQHISTVSSLATAISNDEMERETEALGLEVLRLRKLLTADSETLMRCVREEEEDRYTGEIVAQVPLSDKGKWLTALAQRFLEQLSFASDLRKKVNSATRFKSAPVVQLQALLYQQYAVMQEALLHALSVMNARLQEKARMVDTVRHAALHGGSEEVFALLGARMFENTEVAEEDVHDKLKQLCTACIEQFSEEASRLLADVGCRSQQAMQDLQGLLAFFVEAADTADRLAYGEASAFGQCLTNIKQLGDDWSQSFLGDSQEAIEIHRVTFEIASASEDELVTPLLKLAAKDCEDELQEEVQSMQNRVEERARCIKWLSMQSSHSVIPQLLAIQREIAAEKQKLSTAAQREAKWVALKSDLDAKRREIAAVQSGIAAMEARLAELRAKNRQSVV
ncbi:hypothetical protein ERJ75_001610800 [Trypanosoma vivax]|uniref:Uncharacterized protein n=1 Tax=Trypanosoma vivax (strain Y486) TaxID=1055687 RepID=G0TSY4_TRYVY|nr:hypothetical protein ERJ75_001610800 [Trypanosoma vivax]CCC47064.1 conserved hypothetical protein [Trypanosoma vivax Y486]